MRDKTVMLRGHLLAQICEQEKNHWKHLQHSHSLEKFDIIPLPDAFHFLTFKPYTCCTVLKSSAYLPVLHSFCLGTLWHCHICNYCGW